MTNRSLPPPYDRDRARMTRIRDLREQRDAPVRRTRGRFQPLVLMGWFLVVIVVGVILLGVGLVAFAPRFMSWIEENPGSLEHGLVVDFVEWHQPEALADEPASDSEERVTINVPQGATDADIAQLLFQEGLIANPLAFHYAVLQAGRAGTLQAGPYDLAPNMRPSEIVTALRQPEGQFVTVTIREGLRLEEIVAELLASDLEVDLDQLVGLVREPPADLVADYPFLPPDRSLEGYLYPDTYEFDVAWDARRVVEAFLSNFDANVTDEITTALEQRGLSLDQAVTLASIVEREAVLEEERGLIAGVYINRLTDETQEWVLNADPTLQYALASVRNADLPAARWGEVDWWPPLEAGGADIALPPELAGYQTYLNPGLPPTPIAAPRLTSIEAVAFPDVEDGYFFFVASCPDGERTGAHRFAATLEQHNANVEQAAAECPVE